MADVVDVVIVDERPINMPSGGTSPPLPFARGGHRCADVGVSTACEDMPVVAVADVVVSPVEDASVADVVLCCAWRVGSSFPP